MTKEDIVAAMVILMNTYPNKEDAAEAIARLWSGHTELEIVNGKLLYKSDGKEFK